MMTTRGAIFGAAAAVIIVAPACNSNSVPTSVLLSVQNAAGIPVPDLVQVRVFDGQGAFDAGEFKVSDSVRGSGVSSSSVSLGTIVVYLREGSLAIRLGARGFTTDVPISEGSVMGTLESGRQKALSLTLQGGLAADDDQDGVPNEIDNCPSAKNPNQENRDGLSEGDACTPDGGTDADDAASDDDAGATTDAPSTETLTVGAPCLSADECPIGFCADGVCCDSACGETCRACNVAGYIGLCTMVPDGQDPRNVCAAEDAATCGLDGSCNGAGFCRKYLAGTVCRAPTCATEIDRALAGTCDGGGECLTGETRSCAPFVCANGACRTTCDVATDCAPGASCSFRSCGPKALGTACSAGTECASKNCIDGVCCDVAECAGPCKACNVAGSAGLCRSIKAGEAAKAPGCPIDDPTTCGRTGNCDGAGGCQRYPLGAPCGAQTCSGSTEHAPPTCNGGGMCLSSRTRSCGNYRCQGTACATRCASSADCANSTYCGSGTCRTKKSSGSACAEAVECSSGNCIDGICCARACSATQYCRGGFTCQSKEALGDSCWDNHECLSNFCVDGVCCASACTETCKRCDFGFPLGTCVNTPAGQRDQNAAVPCTTMCNGSGACR
jgi:hypothetical protein